jgi:hypothetical protein
MGGGRGGRVGRIQNIIILTTTINTKKILNHKRDQVTPTFGDTKVTTDIFKIFEVQTDDPNY